MKKKKKNIGTDIEERVVAGLLLLLLHRLGVDLLQVLDDLLRRLGFIKYKYKR